MPSPRLAAALAAAATSLVLAAPAAADSIAYIKDGDVWLTTPDGARQFQVTTTGGYDYASQADDGTILALAPNEHLHRMDRFGTVLADFTTPVSDGPPPPAPPHRDDQTTNYFMGPYDPEISPDGTKVSYTYYWQHYTYNPILNVMENRLAGGTAISHADRLTSWDEFGGNLTGWKHGSWVDDDTLMRSDASTPLAEDVVFNDIAPGGGGELRRWYRNARGYQRFDAELNRQQSMMAMSGTAMEPLKEHLALYRLPGGFETEPEACFAIFDDVKRDKPPEAASWSPEGLRLAWQDTQGIWTMAIPDLANGCVAPTDEPRLLIPGAKHPDWGPADVPTARPAAPAAPAAPRGGGAGGPGKGGAAGGAGKLRVTVAKAGLRQALAKGLRIKVTAPAAGRVTATALKGAKTVARGSGRARKIGALSLRLKFGATGRRALRGARRAKLRVVVRAAGTRRTVPVTLAR
ncbi:MAG TPA: hypothetical protein VF533_12120 [Solirubrobacteraceae bacterium]|jgi:hypothetical protein